MSSAESQVPGAPTWRDYLDARLERLATTEFVADRLRIVHTEVAELKGMLRVMMWGGGIVGAIVLAAALKTLFGW